MMASRCTACFKKGIATVGAEFVAIGLQLCQWHAENIPDQGETPPRMRMLYGPSLMDGSKTFRNHYGADAELLELQERMIRGEV